MTAAFVVTPAALVAASRWWGYMRRFDVLVGMELGLLIVGLRAVQWATWGDVPATTSWTTCCPNGD